MKKFSKLFMLVAVLAMIFSFSAGISAEMPNDGGYVIGDVNDYAYDGQIDVTVVVESRPYSTTDSSKIFEDFNITLGDVNGSGQISYVSDAFYAVSSDPNNPYTLYSSGTNPITATSSFVTGVNDGTKTYSSLFSFDGWMVRVNGQFPLISWTGDITTGGPYGGLINGIPVSDGDVISLYYDCPYILYDEDYQPTISVPTDFIYPEATYNAKKKKVKVALEKSSNHFDAAWNWTIDGYSPYAVKCVPVKIYNAKGKLVACGKTNAKGIATLNTRRLAPGTYTVVANTADNWDEITALNFETFDMVSGVLLKTTTGYSQFTV